MERIGKITSKAAPFLAKDVDTDVIIPAQYLTSVSREGYAEGLFKRVRESDPNFFMHDPVYRGAEILLTGTNFGCGSSREHAVWALQGAGFKALVGPSFADIFTSNAAKNGLLLVTLPESALEPLQQRVVGGGLELAVDLESQTVTAADGGTYRFDYDPFRRQCLLEGLDDMEYLLRHSDAIRAHFERAPGA